MEARNNSINYAREYKKNGVYSGKQYKEAVKKANSDYKSASSLSSERKYKALAESTSRGKNIVSGLANVTAGLTLTAGSGIAMGKSQAGSALMYIGGCYLAAKGTVELVNEHGAKKYR